MKRKLLFCACLLLAALWLISARQEHQERQAENERLQGIQQASIALTMEKSSLMKQQDQIKQEYTQQIQGMGTVSLLFTYPDATFARLIVPALQEREMIGMIAFDLTVCPGAEGWITMAEWQQLEAAGWDFCLQWDGESPLPEWYDQACALMQSKGLSAPSALLIPQYAWNDAVLAEVQELGVQTVIHHGEISGRLYALGYDAEEIWQPGALAWNLEGVSDYVNAMAGRGGSMLLEIQDEITVNEQYMLLFSTMLDKLELWQENEQLLITTTQLAGSYRQGLLEGRSLLEKQMQAELAVIDMSIARIDQELAQLFQ